MINSLNGLNPYSELLPAKKMEAEPGDHDFASAYKEFAEKPDKGEHRDIAAADANTSRTAPLHEDKIGSKEAIPEQVSADQSTTTEPLTQKSFLTLVPRIDDPTIDADPSTADEWRTADSPRKAPQAKPSRSQGTDKAASSMEDTDVNNEAVRVRDLLNILGSSNAIISPTVDQPKSSASNSADASAPVVAMVQLQLPQVKDQTGKRTDPTEGKGGSNTRQSEIKISAADTNIGPGFSTQNPKIEAVELRPSAKDKATDQSDVSSVPQNKTENIVVLDARRYLALAPESNAFNLVSQIAGDKELSSALTSSIIDPVKSAPTSKVVNTLKLQMTPHDLGTVTATLRLRGEELSVAITVQNSAAYNHLSSDQDKMVEALRAQGFAVDQVTVQLVSADRSATQDQQPQSRSQGQQQQEARNGASAQQGRQQGNGASQDNPANRNWQNFDTGGNPASTAAPGPAERRDGQVYV